MAMVTLQVDIDFNSAPPVEDRFNTADHPLTFQQPIVTLFQLYGGGGGGGGGDNPALGYATSG